MILGSSFWLAQLVLITIVLFNNDVHEIQDFFLDGIPYRVIASVISEVGLGSELAFKVPEYDFQSPGGFKGNQTKEKKKES
ncbi:hypothetical protein J1N35_010453 [Gossypium stocksii]|uniref:Uncharacterized protein n=1 Tax=Gossypium stocksii TaxID=47602 RepID=A0A9D3W289_9ROSI|nr:hypothetical protein J1N35_010453 [Gossypium stocksii]